MFTQTFVQQLFAVGLIFMWMTAISCDLIGFVFWLVDLINSEHFISLRWRVVIVMSFIVLVASAVLWYMTLPVGGLKQ